MAPSLMDLPPELIAQIANCLLLTPDIEQFALTSQWIRNLCAPTRYHTVPFGSPRWLSLFDSPDGHFPTWACHVRTLSISLARYYSRIFELEPLFPVLERLTSLREISIMHLAKWAGSIRATGIDRLCQHVPLLRVLKCGIRVDIDSVDQLSLRNMEVLDLSLRSAFGSPQYQPRSSGAGGLDSPHHMKADHDVSPFDSLSNLSALNPALRSLALKLNFTVNRTPQFVPPSTDALFSNTFPELSHFSLMGTPAAPSSALFCHFIASHPRLRTFTCHIFEEDLKFPADALPYLEYLEGSAPLIAAVCDASFAPRRGLVEICGVNGWEQDLSLYLDRVIPKLPQLKTARLQLADDAAVTPDLLETIGKLCPEITHLSLHDPEWNGTMSDFSRAFASFKKLEHLSTSSQFGHTPDRSDPRKREALVWVAARAAPKLSTILWGDDRIGCVVSRAEQRAVRRDESGLVVGIDMNGSWGVGDLEEFWRHLS